MAQNGRDPRGQGVFPDWVPSSARIYLDHTEMGRSIREIARGAGCHASTILRQVRRTESRRDDPLIDSILSNLGQFGSGQGGLSQSRSEEKRGMILQTPDDETLTREAARVLRRMCEPGACLAVAGDLEKAVVARDLTDGRTTRTAVVDRPVAEAMALKGWIDCNAPGRVSRYHITPAGRVALRELLADAESARAGFAEASARFEHRPGGGASRAVGGGRVRYGIAETPLSALARRKDKDGQPFLNADLVAAGERLREDFELSQAGETQARDWEGFMAMAADPSSRPGAAHRAVANAFGRVEAAMRDLGPGLGDVALFCCCYLEGMEAAEQRMGWSARSGKIVLRIALQRLKRHYETTGADGFDMIG